MAEIYYHQLDLASSIDPGDKGRLQRQEGGLWRDYQFDVLGNSGFFYHEYDIVDLISNPVQNLGPAAPTGKGYTVLPTSWASYAPGAGHVDGGNTFLIEDNSASDIVQAFSLIFRAGATVYTPINSFISSWCDPVNAGQLILDSGSIVAGDGVITVYIEFSLFDI